MKEFDFPIAMKLGSGLRPYRSNTRNSDWPITVFNVKASELGLVPFEPVTDRMVDITYSHPFPQLFIGYQFRLLADSAKIYTLDGSWAKTLRQSGLSTDDIWDFMDFGDYWVLLNGAVIAFYNVSGATYSSMASSSTFPRITTGTAFKGRLVGGNVKTSWHDTDTGSVVWSKIGSVDFTPDKQNTAGYWRTPFDGDVKRVMTLNDVVMVYCENGIVKMTPKLIGNTATFGFEVITGVGIAAKGGAGGNDKKHVFVDQENFLWRVEGNGQLEKLGYQADMDDLTAANIVVSYDAGRDEFYIADGSTGYLLTQWGLSQVRQVVGSVQYVDGDSAGSYSQASGDDFLLTTDDLDFGVRGMKTIESLSLGMDDDGTVEARVLYRYDKADSFSNGIWQPVNKEGVVHIGVTAPEFRIALKSSVYTNVNIDYITAHVKFGDNRYKRGIGGTSNAG